METYKFTCPYMVGDVPVGVFCGQAEISLDRTNNTVSIDRVLLNEVGGTRQGEAAGSLYAQIADWLGTYERDGMRSAVLDDADRAGRHTRAGSWGPYASDILHGASAGRGK